MTAYSLPSPASSLSNCNRICCSGAIGHAHCLWRNIFICFHSSLSLFIGSVDMLLFVLICCTYSNLIFYERLDSCWQTGFFCQLLRPPAVFHTYQPEIRPPNGPHLWSGHSNEPGAHVWLVTCEPDSDKLQLGTLAPWPFICYIAAVTYVATCVNRACSRLDICAVCRSHSTKNVQLVNIWGLACLLTHVRRFSHQATAQADWFRWLVDCEQNGHRPFNTSNVDQVFTSGVWTSSFCITRLTTSSNCIATRCWHNASR